MHPDRFYELAVHALAHAGIDTSRYPAAYVKAALDTCKEKVKVFSALSDFSDFYFVDQIASYEPEAAAKDFIPENQTRLTRLRDALNQLSSFDPASIEATLKSTAAELGVKVGALVHPTRLACTGKTIGPSLYHLMAVLGKERVLQRLDHALTRIP